MLLKWSRYCSKHNVFISLHSLQFFQWLVLLQCSGQNYCSSGSQTIISEAVKALYTILLGVNWIHIKNVCVAMVAITREASDIATCFSWHFIASIQGLPTSSFWLLTECKMEGEGLVPLSASDINVYLGRQRGGGAWMKQHVSHMHSSSRKMSNNFFASQMFGTWTHRMTLQEKALNAHFCSPLLCLSR